MNLGNLGVTTAVSTIARNLRRRDKGVRRAAAEALGKIGAVEAVPALLSALKSSREEELRWAVIEALGKIGAPEGVTDLTIIALDRNNSEDIRLRKIAVHALGMIGTSAVITTLMATLKGRTTELRMAAGEALGMMGTSEAIPVLLTMLRDGDLSEKNVAAEALSRIGQSAAHSAIVLMDVLRSCRSDRYEFATAAGMHRPSDFFSINIAWLLQFIGIRVPSSYHAPWEGARSCAAKALERLSPFLESARTTRRAAKILAMRSEGRAAERLSNRLVALELREKHADDLLIPFQIQMSKTRLIITVLSGVCTLALLPIAANIATSNLPEWMQPHTWLAWPALLVLVPITIGLLFSITPAHLPPASPHR